jgi:hypothetical protein
MGAVPPLSSRDLFPGTISLLALVLASLWIPATNAGMTGVRVARCGVCLGSLSTVLATRATSAGT